MVRNAFEGGKKMKLWKWVSLGLVETTGSEWSLFYPLMTVWDTTFVTCDNRQSSAQLPRTPCVVHYVTCASAYCCFWL